jgi:hypothetical protein
MVNDSSIIKSADGRQSMRRYELEASRKALIDDDDGIRSVTVGLCYDFSEKPIDPSETIAMLSALHDEFAKIGDERLYI